MYILNLKRGGGKTVHCIQRSHMTGFPIICMNETHKYFVVQKAKDLGLDIPKPLTVEEVKTCTLEGRKSFGKVIIDEMPNVIEGLLGIPVDTATVTTEFVDWEGRNKK